MFALRLTGLVFWLLVMEASTGSVLAQACHPSEATTEFGRWFDPAISLRAGDTPAPIEAGYENTGSIKLLFEWKDGTSRNWNAVIRDSEFHVLATLGPDDMRTDTGDDRASRWTSRLSKPLVFVELIAEPSTGTVIGISSGIAYPPESEDVRLFSSQDKTPNWHPIFADPSGTIKRSAAFVGMLSSATYDTDGIKRSWCCSGAMITGDLFMTNWHCGGSLGMDSRSYWKTPICKNAVVDLGWDDSQLSRQLGCSEVVLENQENDIAVIRLRAAVGVGSNVGQPAQSVLAKTTPFGAPSFMVHHAFCRPKLVSKCALSESPSVKNGFEHTCDSEPGASGAPLFNSTGRLIGIHHSGFARDATCNALDKVNKGTKIEKIIELLRVGIPADDFAKLWIEP